MDDLPFKPAWWLPNSHFQTIWSPLFRRPLKHLILRRERVELPDGDFLDLDWLDQTEKSPIVILLHGLEGSIDSPYAKGMMAALHKKGWRSVLMHFRGCSGENNRLPRSYHSGETKDFNFIIQRLHQFEPETPLFCVGFSLGGNVLVKWLGETGVHHPVKASVAICVPFELIKAVTRINQGFSRIYQSYLLKCLRRKINKKFSEQSSPIPLPSLKTLRTLKDFDDQITAPLHGFTDALDYYQQSSSRSYLGTISTPTLLLQTKDDPFMGEDLLPLPPELPQNVQLELLEKAGHVGFVEGKYPWKPEYWLEKRVPIFLEQYLWL